MLSMYAHGIWSGVMDKVLVYSIKQESRPDIQISYVQMSSEGYTSAFQEHSIAFPT